MASCRKSDNQVIATQKFRIFPLVFEKNIDSRQLDLPKERHGLPIPVSVAGSGTRMGAAGRGWDVPLSYVSKNTSLAYTRPMSSGLFPATGTTYSLSLLGRSVELVPKLGESVAGKWVARTGWPDLVAVQESATTWKVYDGGGLTFTFENVPDQPTPGVYTLLKRIEGAGNSRVDLKMSPIRSTGPEVPV
jgi:hypothetical protein